jgi:hypothetical protein
MSKKQVEEIDPYKDSCTLTLEQRKKWFRRAEICEAALELLVSHAVAEGLGPVIYLAEEAHDLLMEAQQNLCNDLFNRDTAEDHPRRWR